MISEFSPAFIIQAIFFLFAIGVTWFIPGFILVRSFKLSFWTTTALALLTGFGLWSVMGTLFGILQIRKGMYIYTFFCIILLYIYRSILAAWLKHKKSTDLLLGVLIVSGVFSQSILVFFMNVVWNNTVFTCCGHIPDNHLFLAITNELTHRFPPFEPGVFGAELKNYHFLSHLMMADLIRIFSLPLNAVVYQFSPWIISLLFGLTGIVFASLLKLSIVFKRWIAFFIFFGADAVFILVAIIRTQEPFYFNSMENGVTALFNFPKTYSLIILGTGVIWLILYLKEKRIMYGLLAACFLGITVAHKAFTGVFVWTGMFGVLLAALWKKDIKTVFLSISTVGIGYLLNSFISREAGGFFFSGLWRVHDFFAMKELGLSQHLLARSVFLQAGNWPRVLILDTIMLSIFILVTFGTKLIGIVNSISALKKFPLYLHMFFLFGIVPSSIAGMLFLHSSAGSITVNFLITVFWILSWYAALSLTYTIPGIAKRIFPIIALFVVCITLPRTIHVLFSQLTYKLPVSQTLSLQDHTFFSYFRKNTSEHAMTVLLGYPLEYEQLYFSYLLDRPIYASGNYRGPEVQNIIHHRKTILQLLETSSDEKIIQKTLEQEKISYILYPANTTYTISTMSSTLSEFGRSLCCIILEYKKAK